jgi:uncharacterized protein YkwD
MILIAAPRKFDRTTGPAAIIAPPDARFIHLALPTMVAAFDSKRAFGMGFRFLRFVAPLGLAAATLSACVSDQPPSQPSFYASMADASAVVDADAAASMISGYRQNNSLGAVVVDPDLMRMALEQARAMAARDKLDRSAGREFNGRLSSAGFDARVAVENVGAGYHTLAEAFSGWRDSPPHRANMLKAGVNRMGIAAVYAPQSKYKVFWALIMAARGEG